MNNLVKQPHATRFICLSHNLISGQVKQNHRNVIKIFRKTERKKRNYVLFIHIVFQLTMKITKLCGCTRIVWICLKTCASKFVFLVVCSLNEVLRGCCVVEKVTLTCCVALATEINRECNFVNTEWNAHGALKVKFLLLTVYI